MAESAQHLYRRRPSERRYREALASLDPGATNYLDRSAETANSYFYVLRAVDPLDSRVESGASNEIEVDYRDVFPPAPPARVIALPEAGEVRLLIEASPSADAIGYLIYRRDQGAEFRKITERPIAAASAGRTEHRDPGLVSGLSYDYRVTAVDAAGNEGEPGPEVSASIP
jgi:fibronectin type 3 domain-containing protein